MEMLENNNNYYEQDKVSQQTMFLKAYMHEGKLYVNGEDFIKYNERFPLNYTGNDNFYYYEIERQELENACRKLSNSELNVEIKITDMPEVLVPSISDVGNLIARNNNFRKFDDEVKEKILGIESQLHSLDYDSFVSGYNFIINTLVSMRTNSNPYFFNEMSRILKNETNRRNMQNESKKRR